MKHKMKNGSMTVEATLVLGVLFLLVLSAFYATFYLHDRAVIRGTAAYYAEAMRHMAEEPVDLTGRLEPWRLEDQNVFRTNGYAENADPGIVEFLFRQAGNERMLTSEVTDARAAFEGRKISLSYTAKSRLFGDSIVSRVTGISPEWSDEIRIELKMDPEEFIRLCRGVIWRKKE